MRRKFRIGLLALGVVLGYGSGIASASHCGRARRASFEQHVAKICVDAAKQKGAEASDDP
jgi:hypothetical protein